MSLFIKTIQDIGRGTVLSELDKAVEDLVNQVRATGNPGEINFRIKLKPVDQDGAVVEAKDEIKIKLPKVNKAPSIFYTTEKGELQRNDPRQMELPVKMVPVMSPETRKLATAAN